MKVILQDFEPQVAAVAKSDVVKPMVRKVRRYLNPVKAETRLFHAL